MQHGHWLEHSTWLSEVKINLHNNIHIQKLSLHNTDINDTPDLSERLKSYEADVPTDVHFGLQHFSYNNSGVRDIIYDHLSKTHFNGITVS